MKYSLILSTFISLLFAYSCSQNIDNDEPEQVPLKIEVETNKPNSQDKLLLLLCDNAKLSNMIGVKKENGKLKISDFETAKKLGLIDTFYSIKGAQTFNLPIEHGSYFVQVYDNELNKSFKEIEFNNQNNMYSFSAPIAVGNILAQVRQTSIFGSEIDSNTVLLFDVQSTSLSQLDSLHIDSTAPPELTSEITAPIALYLSVIKNIDMKEFLPRDFTYSHPVISVDGLALFTNIPVGNYYIACFNRVFTRHLNYGDNLRPIEVFKDSIVTRPLLYKQN